MVFPKYLCILKDITHLQAACRLTLILQSSLYFSLASPRSCQNQINSTAVSFPCHLFDQLLKPVTCQFPEASIVINQQKQQWQKLIMALSVLPVVHPGQFLFSCQEQLLRMIKETLHIFYILQNSKTPWHILKAAERKVIHRYQKETGLSG